MAAPNCAPADGEQPAIVTGCLAGNVHVVGISGTLPGLSPRGAAVLAGFRVPQSNQVKAVYNEAASNAVQSSTNTGTTSHPVKHAVYMSTCIHSLKKCWAPPGEPWAGSFACTAIGSRAAHWMLSGLRLSCTVMGCLSMLHHLCGGPCCTSWQAVR